MLDAHELGRSNEQISEREITGYIHRCCRDLNEWTWTNSKGGKKITLHKSKKRVKSYKCVETNTLLVFSCKGENLQFKSTIINDAPHMHHMQLTQKGLTVDGLKFIALYNKQKKIVFFIKLYLINCFNLLNHKNFIPLYSSYETFDNFIINKFKLRIIMVFNLVVRKGIALNLYWLKIDPLRRFQYSPQSNPFLKKKGSP